MIVLQAEDVRRLLPMPEAIELAREAFRGLSDDQVDMPLRTRLSDLPGGGECLCMPVLRRATTGDTLAVKVLSSFPSTGHRDGSMSAGVVLLMDPSDGRPAGLIDAGALTLIRSGAASGIATSLLSRSDATTAACLGAGALGFHQVEAVCSVRNIRELWLYDPNTERVRALASALRAVRRLSTLDIRLAATSEEAVADADIICTATDSSTPVFDARHLKTGVHINGVGSCHEEAQEIPSDTVCSALVVVDSLPACLREAGDILVPIRDGLFRADRIHAEIKDLLTGSRPGRTSEMQTTLFKSVGIAIQDAVVADFLCREARARNIGKHVAWI